MLPAGPPWVVTATVSKIWIDPVTLVTSTNTITGRSSGRVMRRKLCHSLAPSSAAASYRLRGMFCSPARNSMATSPMCRHTLTAATDSSAWSGPAKKGCGPLPSAVSAWFTTPSTGSSSHSHTRATSTLLSR